MFLMKFEELKLSQKTLQALNNLGFSEPTQVQIKAIPSMISGIDLLVRSQTGTGKTAAFGIGITERIASGSSRKALILTPTRELALQVSTELRAISALHRFRVFAVFGGQNIEKQISDIQCGFQVLVATPGRLLDLARRGVVRLNEFDVVVLDEADHMLDIGFLDEVTEILKQLSHQRITMLLSATLSDQIMQIASEYLKTPETIEIGALEVVSTVDEQYIEISPREKFTKLLEVLNEHKQKGMKILIFRETKIGTVNLQEMLWKNGYRAGLLQGDMSQSRRI